MDFFLVHLSLWLKFLDMIYIKPHEGKQIRKCRTFHIIAGSFPTFRCFCRARQHIETAPLDPLNDPAVKIWLAGCEKKQMWFGENCKFLLEAPSWNQFWKSVKAPASCGWRPSWFGCHVSNVPDTLWLITLLLPYYGPTAGVTDCDWMIMTLVHN